MAYAAVNQTSTGVLYEKIYRNKPVKEVEEYDGYITRKSIYWWDKTEYNRQRRYSIYADDGSIKVPVGTIKKLTGRDLTPDDNPIKLI